MLSFSSRIEKSDVMDRTGHACRLDFERFAAQTGVVGRRAAKILARYTNLPESVVRLVDRSFLPEKMKRSYLRIVNERIRRFVRVSE